MAKAKFKVEGIGPIRKSLQRFAKKAGPAAVKVIQEVAERAAAHAQTIAPKETGEIVAGIVSKKIPKGAIFASEARHSIHVEYGTSEQGAQAYLRPSLRKALSGARKQIRDAIKNASFSAKASGAIKAFKKSAGKLAKKAKKTLKRSAKKLRKAAGKRLNKAGKSIRKKFSAKPKKAGKKISKSRGS